MSNPSEELVRLIFKKMDCGGSIFTEKVKEKITPLVKSAIETVINDKVKSHLNNALNTTEAKSEEIAAAAAAAPQEEADRGIVTTQDEIDAHNIIRAILSEDTPVEDVTMRDAKSYCAILYQDNNRKPLCRLFFNNPERKAVMFFDDDAEERVPIQTVLELYSYSGRLKNALAKYRDPQQMSGENA